MAAIITRETAGTGATVAGVPLTNAQVDQNFINLNTELITKLPLSGGTLTGDSTVSVNTWQKWTLETIGVVAKARQGSDANGLNFTTNALWTGSAWQEDDTAKKKFAYIQHLGNGRHEFRTAGTGSGVSWITNLAVDELGTTLNGNITANAANQHYIFNKPTAVDYQTTMRVGSEAGGLYLTSDSAIISKGAYYNNGWIATAAAGSIISFADIPSIATFSGQTPGQAFTMPGYSVILHAGNYNTYSPTLTGSGASGTWAINITGNAGTATSATSATSAGKLTGGGGAVTDLNTAPSLTAGDVYFQTYSASATNSPVVVDNANGLLTLVSHPSGGTGTYGKQLSFANDDNLRMRLFTNGSFGNWRTLLHDGNYNTYSPTLTGGGASGTWAISVTGNAGTATSLQTTRLINGASFNGTANVETSEWIHSNRDFPSGTLITTSIDYSVTDGDPFVLEIRGNSYGDLIPFEIQYQGYIYSNTIINHGGYSVGTSITGLVALNVGGKLCFWFPSQTYWHGYSVKAYTAYSGRPYNKVTSITNEVKPVGTKEVALSANIRQVLHSSNYNNYSPTLTGGGASGTWAINITGSAASATSATTANSALNATNSSFSAYLSVIDNRSVNDQPQNKQGNVVSADFKTTAAADTPPVVAGNGYAHIITVAGWSSGEPSGGWPSQLSIGDGIAVRQAASATTWGSWRTILTSNNYNSYSPTLTGGGASGTWAINITGNASTATVATTAGTVTNGVYINNQQRISGNKQFDSSNSAMATSTASLAAVEAYGTGGAAFMAFHRPGVYAAYFGIDSDNVWKVGGWSMGANAYPILHSNNFSSYALPLTGGSLTGPVNISGTGNAAVTLYQNTTANTGSIKLQAFGNKVVLQAGKIGTASQPYLDITAGDGTGGMYVSPTGEIGFYQAIIESKLSVGAGNAIDLRTANYFTKTISTTTTFSVSNIPGSGSVASFILDLTNGGSQTVTWWANVKWAGGTAPTLTASGRDVLGFFTHDGGTTWTGLLLGKDVK